MINRTSTSAANSIVIQSPCRLVRLTVSNKLAGSQYIQMFDAGVLPADGAEPSIPPVKINQDDVLVIEYGEAGRTLNNGLAICNSTTELTKTIGATNCWFDLQLLTLDGNERGR